MRKPVCLHPPDLTVSPQVAELGCEGLRIGGIERRLDGRPNPLSVLRMQPFRELCGVRLVFGNVEHLLQSCIPQRNMVDRIVLPPAEPGCIEGKLQAIFARLQ
jgi:hypothetical protein